MRWLKAALISTTFLTGSISAQAQLLINQYIPDPNLGFGADFFRRGSGYGSVADTANGQATAVGTTVLTRPQPEYDPQGMQLGKFRIDVTGSEGLGYDSNPLGLSSSKGSITNESQAAATASGVWDSAGLTARLSIDDVRYWRFSQLNHTDYSAYLGGYYDFANDRLQGSFTHLKLNELPTGVDAIGVGSNHKT